MSAHSTPPVAYSYVRFSTPEQLKGDSLRRQTEAAADWCRRNGATLDTSTTYRDLGASAFKGAHRSDKQALGAFLKLVESGKVPKGSYLIIENLDRLSREEERTALRLWMDILDHGVNIVQLTPETVFRHERSDMFDVMRAVMELSRGHGESAMKSKRNGAAWEAKRRRARTEKHVLTHRLPAWVEERGGKLCLIPERAAVVKRIYQLAAAGYGGVFIVRRLRQDKVPPMGRSGQWHRNYVAEILCDRRPLGEFQPRDTNNKPAGDPIPDYFPAVVTEQEWYAARGSILGRSCRRGRVGAHVNLFACLLKDARDGLPYYVAPKYGAKRTVSVLINAGFREGTSTCRSFPLETFERAVLSLLKEVNPAEVLGRDDSPAEARALETELQQTRMHRAALAEDLGRGYSRSIADALRKVEAREREVAEQLARAKRAAANPLSESWADAKTLAEALDAAPDPTDARLRLRDALRRIVEEIRLLVVPTRARPARPRLGRRKTEGPTLGHDRLAAVQVFFAGGQRRDFMVLHRPPKSNGKKTTPGGWWAKSLCDVIDEADLDLRKKADARRLEKALGAVDLGGPGG
jgi:DNA invertase Pin-like site-specific DNA recombinase